MVPGVPGSSWFADIIVNFSKMISLCLYNCSESRVSEGDGEDKFLLPFRTQSLRTYIPHRRFAHGIYFYYFLNGRGRYVETSWLEYEEVMEKKQLR
jgi:hypothetical protein